jgi:hypothetical protein
MNGLRPDKEIEGLESMIRTLKSELEIERDEHAGTASVLLATQAERNVIQDQNDQLITDFSKSISLLAPFGFQYQNKMTDQPLDWQRYHRAHIFVLQHYPGGKDEYLEVAKLARVHGT